MNHKSLFWTVVFIVIVVVAIGAGFYLGLAIASHPRASVATQNQTPQIASSTGDAAGNCFYSGTLAPAIDTTNWNTLNGYGFTMKYPDALSVQYPDPNGEFPSGSRSCGTGICVQPSYSSIVLVTSSYTGYAVEIASMDLRNIIFDARLSNLSPVVYEPLSNTWWQYPGPDTAEYNPDQAKQCVPNMVGRTDNGGLPIYEIIDGDAGSMQAEYFVVMRDVVTSDNYTPMVVEFYMESDPNDPSSTNIESGTLENIIRTVKVAPTSRG
jgi:uncharacterized protein (UPF0333 family)